MYSDPTIFELLEKTSGDAVGRRAWRVYHVGPAQVMAFRKLWDGDRIGNFDDFRKHVAESKPARYSFIEPNHNTPAARRLHPLSSSRHSNNNRVPLERYFSDDPRNGADFRRPGARVPTIAVSPWILPATLDDTSYDDASIPRTAGAASFAHLAGTVVCRAGRGGDGAVPRASAATPLTRPRRTG